MDGFKLFWSGPNHFGHVQVNLLWTKSYIIDLSKMIWTNTNWTHQEQLVFDQNYLDRQEGQGISSKKAKFKKNIN